MTTILLWAATALLAVVIALLIVLLRQKAGPADPGIAGRLEAMERNQERGERAVREELTRNREEQGNQNTALRGELAQRIQGFNDSIVRLVGDQAGQQAARIENLTRSNEQRMENLQTRVEQKLTQIQQENAAKLEEMRKTVDEKLQTTLERRLGESFKLVGDRLEQVHKGLGEMQALAGEVGDLKKVFANVKTRGTWGEIQLGCLLEQVLAPEQFAHNVRTRDDSAENVEFAVKLPGRDETAGRTVYLPMDSKFPKEDYERLLAAMDAGDKDQIEKAQRGLERAIRDQAKTIKEKYLNPPTTTDFGIMFLPSEGLYGEVLRRPGLVEQLQRQYRVCVTGPTILAALLNSLQMGFRTLAIQKHASEVWEILGAVKTEFGKFDEVLARVQKQLQAASHTIEDDVAQRSRAIEKRLRKVQELPAGKAEQLLPADGETYEADDLSASAADTDAPSTE